MPASRGHANSLALPCDLGKAGYRGQTTPSGKETLFWQLEASLMWTKKLNIDGTLQCSNTYHAFYLFSESKSILIKPLTLLYIN